MTAKGWNAVWKRLPACGIRLGSTLLYREYLRALRNIDLKNSGILELGSGPGIISLLLAKKFNSKVTLVDFSPRALRLAEIFFKEADLDAHMIRADIFKFKSNRRYDFVHSQGLMEHYKFEQQKKLLRIHKRLTKKNGYFLVSVPRPSLFYTTLRTVTELLLGGWPFGYEKPLSCQDIRELFGSIGLDIVDIYNSPINSLVLVRA